MASRQVGPWKLMVKDRSAPTFERFIATDGNRLAWVWRALGDAREAFSACEELRPPWLPAVVGPRIDDGPVVVSECLPGVPLAEILQAVSGGLPIGAAAALALAVARGVQQLPETIDPGEVPPVTAGSVLVGFDGAVTLTPWHGVPSSDPGILLELGEYLTPLWARSASGWRIQAPTHVLLDAFDTSTRRRPGSMIFTRGFPPDLREMIQRALHVDPKVHPSFEELVGSLAALASPAELEALIATNFAHEPKEQEFDRARARGDDPEAVPPHLLGSISNEPTDEAFGVLADWLLAEGRPRGELAAIQLKLEQGVSLELQRAEATLLSRHRSLLPFTLRERLQLWRPIWKAGWLVGLELKSVPEPGVLTEILTHPTLRFLRRLRVKPDGGHSKELVEVLSALSLPALRQVELDGGVHIHGARLRKAKPELSVDSSTRAPPFPARRRPEASIPNAKVGVGDRQPAPGLPPLNRLMDWLAGDD